MRLNNRIRKQALFLGVIGWFVPACGGGQVTPATSAAPPGDDNVEAPASPAPMTDSEEQEDEPEGDAAAPAAFPTKCAKAGAAICTPPARFVKQLCSGFHPDAALALFATGTPWKHGYLAANVRAWNASGGASSEDELKFDEEVLVLRHRKADTGGMQVSGAGGSFDVLRWDGTCATLSEEELTMKQPPRALHAQVTWKDLGDQVRAAILEEESLKDINTERKKECKGINMGAVTKKCVQLVEKQSKMIVEYVRSGGNVPAPKSLE